MKDWVYPKRKHYSYVFNTPLNQLTTIDGTCKYCRRKDMPLILDAHDIYSCPECLALDLYLDDSQEPYCKIQEAFDKALYEDRQEEEE